MGGIHGTIWGFHQKRKSKKLEQSCWFESMLCFLRVKKKWPIYGWISSRLQKGRSFWKYSKETMGARWIENVSMSQLRLWRFRRLLPDFLKCLSKPLSFSASVMLSFAFEMGILPIRLLHGPLCWCIPVPGCNRQGFTSKIWSRIPRFSAQTHHVIGGNLEVVTLEMPPTQWSKYAGWDLVLGFSLVRTWDLPIYL